MTDQTPLPEDVERAIGAIGIALSWVPPSHRAAPAAALKLLEAQTRARLAAEQARDEALDELDGPSVVSYIKERNRSREAEATLATVTAERDEARAVITKLDETLAIWIDKATARLDAALSAAERTV